MVTNYIYGWQLRLIHVVTRCLADKPDDRPGPDELMQHVNWIEDQAGYDNPGTFFDRYYGSPPDVSTPARIFELPLIHHLRCNTDNGLL